MDTINSKESLQIWQITKINLRHNFILHFIMACAILVLTPLLFGIRNLDTSACAVPLEIFVSLIGVVLLTPIFQPEQSKEIEDIILSKYRSSSFIHMIRTVYSLISIVLLIFVFGLFMRISASSVTLVLIFGCIADAMLLGSLGMITAVITNNTAVSYMVPLVYYLLNLLGGSKLGSFYLFSMMDGVYTTKLWLFLISILLILAAIGLKRMINNNK